MSKPKQEFAKVQLALHCGRRAVHADNQPVPAGTYCDYILRGDWRERNREFVQSGVKVFHLTVPHGDQGNGHDPFDSAFWVDDGVYPVDDHAYEYSLDHQAETILEMQPQAKFYIKFNLSPPIRWTEKHPGEMQTDEDGKRFREANWSSERYLRDLGRYIRHLVTFCEGRAWAGHILGYLALPYGEGCTKLTIAGKMFDCSAAAQRGFRSWLKKKYRTVCALRKAWGDSRITFATVQMPRDCEWLARKQEGRPTLGGLPLNQASLPSNSHCATSGLFHWIEPANAVREHDYCRFQRDAFQNWVRMIATTVKKTARSLGRERIFGIDVGKQPLLGWQIQSNFDGIGDGQSFPNILTLSGSWGTATLFDEPALDCLWTPADYTARTVGFAYEPEGISDSLVLRGKTMMCENDARCYVGASMQDQGAFRTPREVEAGLLRNEAMALSRGFESYWCNVGSSFLHDKKIHKTIKKITRMLARIRELPHRETPHCIALVIDDESVLYEDFTSGYQSLSVIWQRVLGLAHCGVPYRIYLLSDLQKKNMPAYRTWLFPNLFRIDGNVMRILREKVLRNGNLAIFGPGTGITDGRTLNARQATNLLGVPMELHPRTAVRHVIVQDNGHPISAELPANHVYGDSMPYGPALTPREWAVENTAGAVPLGHANLCWFIHRTGLFLKEFGKGCAGNGKPGPRGKDDYGVVFSCALPLPPTLLRACARYAGSNIWCEEDDVIYASNSMVAIHSSKAGARTIQLPRACKVCDAVTGKLMGKGNTKQIGLRITPPQTRIFTLI